MKIIILLLFALSAIAISANAISVVADYLVNNSLVLVQGESKIYSIRLQNPADNEVGIKLDYDRTLMKVIDYKEVYILPPKTGYKILFNVTAPEDSGLYDVSYTVGEVEPSSGSGLPILLKINKNFKLKVVEDPKKEFKLSYGSIMFAIALLAFMLYIFIKKTEIKQKSGGKPKLKQKNN